MAEQLLAATGLPSSPELQHDLDKIRYLLATLERLPITASDDFDDIVWLRCHQRFLHTVLTSRATMRRQQVVDLAQWRSGSLPAAA